MSCLDYNDTWESMNQLEESFNRIATVQDLINVLQNAVNNDNKDEIVDTTAALVHYIQVYTKEYDKQFKITWENVVVKLASHEKNDYISLNYDEIVEGLLELEAIDQK